MKPDKKAKWIVGITGTALSAFILSQLDANTASDTNTQPSQQVAYQTTATENSINVSAREQELANKDWTNFTVEDNKQPAQDSTVNQPAIQQQPVNPPTDRNTSRS